MPFSSTNPLYKTSNPLPQHLDHKPVYALPYQHFDGIYSKKTDIRYTSQTTLIFTHSKAQ